MQIKKFHADSFSNAMAQVKKELGEHALILKSQSLKGAPGHGKYRRRVEITAANDPAYSEGSKMKVEEQSKEMNTGPLDDMGIKSILMALLSQTDRARALGLKDYQLGLYRKLTEGGINDQMVARMFERLNSEKNPAGKRDVETDE